MFVKLALLACCLSASSAVYNGPLAGGQPAALYPAGVSPQACPNFPHCSNPAVSANPQQAAPQAWNQPQQSWNQQGQWNQQQQQGSWNQNQNQGQWNQGAVPQYGNGVQERLNRGEYVGDGDYRGEGLAEALAPGYANSWNQGNNWNNQGNQWNQGPQGIPPNAAQTHGVGQIPAGVDARSCPNYPFCA